jgi:hypothetical protein
MSMSPQPQRTRPEHVPDLPGMVSRLWHFFDQATPGSLRELEARAKAQAQDFRIPYRERRYWADVLHLVRNQAR